MKKLIITSVLLLQTILVFSQLNSGNFTLKPETAVVVEVFTATQKIVYNCTHSFTNKMSLDMADDGSYHFSQSQIVFPAVTLKSNSKMCDKILQDALKTESCPEIVFIFKHIEKSVDDFYELTADLTMAGVTQEKVFRLKMNPATTGYNLKGIHAAELTSFEIDPPVVLGGLVRVQNKFNIHLNMFFEIKA